MEIETLPEPWPLPAPTPESWLQPGERRPSRAGGPAWRRACRRINGRLQDAVLPTRVGRWLHGRLVEARHLPAVRVPLPNLPPGLEGMRVAFISDLHAGCFTLADDFLDWAERLCARAPELICLGGDLIDGEEEQVRLLGPGLVHLARRHTLFAVPGNHDYYPSGRIDRWRSFLESHGVRVLWNRGVRLEANETTFWLAGVDDLSEGRPDLSAALRGRNEGETTLLLSHHPDLFPRAARAGVDLQLSGHTHGGQIRLCGWAPVTRTSHGLVQGVYRDGAARLFVGAGAGATVLPLRLGVRPEIAILRLTGE